MWIIKPVFTKQKAQEELAFQAKPFSRNWQKDFCWLKTTPFFVLDLPITQVIKLYEQTIWNNYYLKAD